MTEIRDVPSPFCGMGTDDLAIEVNGQNVKVLSNGCAVNTPAFEHPITDTKPRINGKEVSLDEAVAHAATLLKNTHFPVIASCATDVNGMRGLLALADRSPCPGRGFVFENLVSPRILFLDRKSSSQSL